MTVFYSRFTIYLVFILLKLKNDSHRCGIRIGIMNYDYIVLYKITNYSLGKYT